MFHLTQFPLYIALVVCSIILPDGIKNCTLVSGGKAGHSFLLFINIIARDEREVPLQRIMLI